MHTNVGKTALFYSIVTICLGLRPRMNIFYKTEFQTVILRCWTGLNSNWLKVMTQNANIFVSDFLNFVKKTTHLCNVFSGFMQFFHFSLFLHSCHNFWTILDLFSISKWQSELQFCGRYSCTWPKNGKKWSLNGNLCQSQILGIRFYMKLEWEYFIKMKTRILFLHIPVIQALSSLNLWKKLSQKFVEFSEVGI